MSTEAAYNAIPAVRWSKLKAMRISPLAFRWNELHGDDEDSVSMRIGRAVHSMLLEPEKFLTDFAIWPKVRRGKEYEAFVEKQQGKDIIIGSEAEAAEQCVKAIQRHPLALDVLTSATRREHTLTWTDATTGLRCKARCDLINGALAELKTGQDVTPRLFAQQCARLAYHGQAAWYTNGLEANGFDLHGRPRFVVVQNRPPFDVVVFRASEQMMEQGHALARKLLDLYAECVEAERWDGIAPDREVDLHMPAWVDNDNDETEPPITIGGVAVEF